MSHRFTLIAPPHQLAKLFSDVDISKDLEPRFNIAPSQLIAIIRLTPFLRKREMAFVRWGLIPSWSENYKTVPNIINTPWESIETKKTFREAFRRGRCLIPANGFFEWQTIGRKKTPYYIHRADNSPFAFAGLCESWIDDRGKAIDSCTILTTAANEIVQPIQDRMPVIIPREHFARWLDPTGKISDYLDLFRPYPGSELTFYRVSGTVNDSTNDHPDCVQRSKTDVDKQMCLWEE